MPGVSARRRGSESTRAPVSSASPASTSTTRRSRRTGTARSVCSRSARARTRRGTSRARTRTRGGWCSRSGREGRGGEESFWILAKFYNLTTASGCGGDASSRRRLLALLSSTTGGRTLPVAASRTPGTRALRAALSAAGRREDDAPAVDDLPGSPLPRPSDRLDGRRPEARRTRACPRARSRARARRRARLPRTRRVSSIYPARDRSEGREGVSDRADASSPARDEWTRTTGKKSEGFIRAARRRRIGSHLRVRPRRRGRDVVAVHALTADEDLKRHRARRRRADSVDDERRGRERGRRVGVVRIRDR